MPYNYFRFLNVTLREKVFSPERATYNKTG